MQSNSSQCFERNRQWSASWVWNNRAPGKNAWVLFRCEFDVKDIPGVTLFITADTRYRVWVNGERLGDGPPQSQPYHQYYDAMDLASVVDEGRNCIAVLVHHQGIQSGTRGGLLAEVVDASGAVLCATGSSWRSQIGHAWRVNTDLNGMNKIGPFQEHVDLRSMPQGWKAVGFEGPDWAQVDVVSSRGGSAASRVMPWCRLIPRDIAFLKEEGCCPVSIQRLEECLDLENRRLSSDLSISLSQVGRDLAWAKAAGTDRLLGESGETVLACSDRHHDGVTDGRYDPCLTLDFGRVITAYADVEVEAPAGAVIEIGYAERLVDGRFNNAIECPFADKVTCVQGYNHYRPLVWRSFRYLRLRVKACEQGMKVKAARAVAVTYPYKASGHFAGDARLESVFKICRRTLELCSIESLMDTPFREQAQWLGDVSAVTIPGILACFGDTKLPGKFFRQAAMNSHPTGLIANISNVATVNWAGDIPDYSLWWVIALWRFYLYTGDARYVHECYPEVQRIMRVHLERQTESGILDAMFGWVFIDWAHVDVDGMSAAYNAIYAGACDAAAALATVKGDDWAVDRYAGAAARVRAAFVETFWHSEKDVVVDAVLDGRQSDRISEQSNAAAIAFGCVSAQQADSIIKAIFDEVTVDSVEAQPFFMVVVLKALLLRERRDLALGLIRERWGGRMVDRGLGSCTEEWYQNGSWRNGYWKGFERTLSHAWSGCAAEFLISGLAGLEILSAGGRRIQLNPYRASFPYELSVPLNRGVIHLNWDGSTFSVDAPDDVEVELEQ